MLEGLVREIKDPFKKEEVINPIEVSVYLELIKDKCDRKDKNEIAEDLFNQLIDKKTKKYK